ncbi:hypothetical protein [Aureibacter tunicatorum]|uniref:Uncharacterized protein n=1 Tax=Aureibacter tunicatorum TaxID=866807 RepID=A0AAE3XLF1_9BACT|nr:hypothetical protein [Aureibacter tunicatorum]MDR6239042.1 hypothetical protein [Aureibacter tunicatorum]BDD05032.1 hypothetical protein AUTU_25150 [Aureibacter tunicatorum]
MKVFGGRNIELKINHNCPLELKRGEMLRFWLDGNMVDHYERELRRITRALEKVIVMPDNIEALKWSKCTGHIKMGLLDFVFPMTAGEFLMDKAKLNPCEAVLLLSEFGLDPLQEIRKMTCLELKLLTIVSRFQNKELVVFDYFGIDDDMKKKITSFVMDELLKEKTAAISFASSSDKITRKISKRFIDIDIKHENENLFPCLRPKRG